jgi:hypothetical protein
MLLLHAHAFDVTDIPCHSYALLTPSRTSRISTLLRALPVLCTEYARPIQYMLFSVQSPMSIMIMTVLRNGCGL